MGYAFWRKHCTYTMLLACYSELKSNIAEPYTCLEFITPSASLNIYTFIKFVKKYVIQNRVRYHKVDLE